MIEGEGLEFRHHHEVLRVEPWGLDSVRVRAANGPLPNSDAGALEAHPPASDAVVTSDGRLVNGELTVEITQAQADGAMPAPLVRFLRTSTGEELLAEAREHFWWPGARVYYGNRSGAGEIHQQFKAYAGERLYGMGQRTHGRLDHKGLGLDLVQRNADVSIPLGLRSRRHR